LSVRKRARYSGEASTVGVSGQAELVELAPQTGLVRHRARRDDAKHDLVPVCVGARGAVAAHDAQLLVRIPRFQAVRSASDGMPPDLGFALAVAERGRGDDRDREVEHSLGIGLRESDAHGRGVGRLDRRDVLERGAPGRGRDLRVAHALDREADVVGGHGRAALPGGLRVEAELVGQAVRTDRPGLRERGHGLALRVEADERPEDHRVDEDPGLLGVRRRIQVHRVADQVALQDRPGGGLLRAAAGEGGQHGECGREARETLHEQRPTE
jgi:hypothetical protein